MSQDPEHEIIDIMSTRGQDRVDAAPTVDAAPAVKKALKAAVGDVVWHIGQGIGPRQGVLFLEIADRVSTEQYHSFEGLLHDMTLTCRHIQEQGDVQADSLSLLVSKRVCEVLEWCAKDHVRIRQCGLKGVAGCKSRTRHTTSCRELADVYGLKGVAGHLRPRWLKLASELSQAMRTTHFSLVWSVSLFFFVCGEGHWEWYES